jgi:hypothetical protein
MNDTLLETSAVFVGPVGSEGGRSPSTLSIGAKTATDGSSKTSLMSLFPSRFHWTMWCPKKPGPAQAIQYQLGGVLVPFGFCRNQQVAQLRPVNEN